jgi:DNA modification methylase
LELNKIYCMNCIEGIKLMEGASVNSCITSPPYWNLRDYELEPTYWPEVQYSPMAGLPEIHIPEWTGCLGLEPTIEMYIGHIVCIFREVRRVLRKDGTLWLNWGDSYCSTAPETMGDNIHIEGTKEETRRARKIMRPKTPHGLKPKDLIGIPWRAAFALQADGWYLRSDIVWEKPNPMPESVTDRPTKAHEYIFLFSKSKRYYYDQSAIREPVVCPESNTPEDILRSNLRKRRTDPKGNARTFRGGAYCNHSTFNNAEGGNRTVTGNYHIPSGWDIEEGSHGNFHKTGRRSGNIERKSGEDRDRPGSHLGTSVPWEGTTKNKRDVWTVSSQPYKEAHFATYPPKLIEPCVLAGCPVGGVVFDPFMGAGTTALVAKQWQRDFIGFELNPEYCRIAERRIQDVQLRMG